MSVSQITSNALRIFIGTEVLWGLLGGRNCSLTWEEFFYCYKPQEIPQSKGFYNFVCHRAPLRLISDMPDSNHQWKARFFFVQGVNWVCHPNEWDSIGSFYDHSWGQLLKSSKSSISFWVVGLCRSSINTYYWTNSLFVLFQPKLARRSSLRKSHFWKGFFRFPLRKGLGRSF